MANPSKPHVLSDPRPIEDLDDESTAKLRKIEDALISKFHLEVFQSPVSGEFRLVAVFPTQDRFVILDGAVTVPKLLDLGVELMYDPHGLPKGVVHRTTGLITANPDVGTEREMSTRSTSFIDGLSVIGLAMHKLQPLLDTYRGRRARLDLVILEDLDADN